MLRLPRAHKGNAGWERSRGAPRWLDEHDVGAEIARNCPTWAPVSEVDISTTRRPSRGRDVGDKSGTMGEVPFEVGNRSHRNRLRD